MMKSTNLLFFVFLQLFVAVCGKNDCYKHDLITPIEILGTSYSRVFHCTFGYLSFSDSEQDLTLPSDFLRDNLTGPVFAPLLIDGGTPYMYFYQRPPSDSIFQGQVDYVFLRTYPDPDFTADFLIMTDWAVPNGGNRVRFYLVQDNNYKNSGQSKLVTLTEYYTIATHVDRSTGTVDYARAGVHVPNYG